MTKQRYEFDVVYSGIAEVSDALKDKLALAGLGDVVPRMDRGRLCLKFSREATTFDEAQKTAMADLKVADIGGKIEFVHRVHRGVKEHARP